MLAVSRTLCVVTAVIALACVRGLHGQIVQRMSGPSASTVMVSPTVAATYVVNAGDGDLDHLELLALWRGRPAWYRASSGGSGSSFGGSTFRAYSTFGSHTLEVQGSLVDKAAVILGQRIDLRRSNIVVIDRIDEGASLTSTMLVEAWVASTSIGVEKIRPVLDLPEVRALLQCDVQGAMTEMSPTSLNVCTRRTP
jgi:hypothetical protein